MGALIYLCVVLAAYAVLMTYLFWNATAGWQNAISRWEEALKRGDFAISQWKAWQRECRRQGLRARQARKRARWLRESECGR